MKMRVVFAGTPATAVPTLAALLERGHEVVGVLTRTDAPLGRKKVLTPSPVAEFAAAKGLNIFKANRLDAAAASWLTELRADIGVVVAYGALLRQEHLDVPQLGWVNLHFSALPAWRGAAPVQRALMAGATELGMDVFRLVLELDAGDIVARDSYQVPSGFHAGQVLQEMAVQGSKTVLAALDILQQNPNAGVAQVGEPSYAHKLDRAAGKLDFKQPATKVLAHWAGVTPEPGAYALVDGQSVKVLEMGFAVGADPLPNVTLGTAYLQQQQAYVMCGDTHLQLRFVQPAGKAKMAASDWLRGRGGMAAFSVNEGA